MNKRAGKTMRGSWQYKTTAAKETTSAAQVYTIFRPLKWRITRAGNDSCFKQSVPRMNLHSKVSTLRKVFKKETKEYQLLVLCRASCAGRPVHTVSFTMNYRLAFIHARLTIDLLWSLGQLADK